MKDIPLLFTGAMVRQVLAGAKTQTRRLKFKGAAGDRVWVKETFAVLAEAEVIYRATEGRSLCDLKWRPSILMPRKLSRVTLEVLSVRVEPLQSITPKDILAEGVVLRSHQDQNLGKCPISAFDKKLYVDLRSLWVAGWDSINGRKAPWSSNPAVHVIEFRRAA